jgi:dynein heavy chain
LDKYVQSPEFDAEKIAKVSTAAAGLCKWSCAMSIYGAVYKTVAPKREKLKQAMMSLEKKQAALRKAQASLQEVKEKVQALQDKYDTSISTKERLALESSTLEMKLERADQLVNGLSGERERWEGSVADLYKDISNSVGDCVVAAAFLSYAGDKLDYWRVQQKRYLTIIMDSGPFNSDYRRLLVTETWMPMIVKLQIPISPTFDFSLFLAEPTDVREWNLKGLPSDAFSIENGVLVTRGRRWPLMVDPQVWESKLIIVLT